MRNRFDMQLIWRQMLGRRQVRAGSITMMILCVFCAAGLARGQRGTVKGIVKDHSGTPIARAEVVAKTPDGQTFYSAITDSKGRFQFPVLSAGHWLLDIHCPGYSHSPRHSIFVRSGQSIEVDFVLEKTSHFHSEKSSSLGTISFYSKPDFESGGLKDPSAGGGYSDSTSAQSQKMLNQYLLPSKIASDGKASAAPSAASLSAKSNETDFENTGSRLLARKNFLGATEVFKQGVSLYPNSPRLQMGLGVSLYQTGKYDAAVQALADASRLSSDDSSPLLLLAEACQFATTPQSGSDALFRHFLVLHPRSATGHYAYGLYIWSQLRTGDDKNALELAQSQFEKAVAIDRNDAAAHYHLGILYDRQKTTKRAIHEYLEVIRANPRLAEPHYRLSLDYRKAGEQEKAIHEMEVYEQLQKADVR